MYNVPGDNKTIWMSAYSPRKKSLLGISRKLKEHLLVKEMYG